MSSGRSRGRHSDSILKLYSGAHGEFIELRGFEAHKRDAYLMVPVNEQRFESACSTKVKEKTMKKIFYALMLVGVLTISNKSSVTSPIAPTPTCLPGDPKGCPSQDWGK